MKCQAVACIWSGAPPFHRITATAVLSQPPTLYTGGSDGSIIRWSLSGDDSHQEIRATAMLCGHASAIVDLEVCSPVIGREHREAENSDNVGNSSAADYGAVISACADGVLCIWSRGTGHCKRRRKMPPWVGTPVTVRMLPASPRYVCIACYCVDSINVSHHQPVDHAELSEASVDRETHNRRTSKCAVVIVDSRTLNIVQTVYHGNLSIGPLKFMAIVPSAEHKEKHSVLMFDALGKQQLVPISKDPDPNGEGGIGLHRSTSSHTEMSIWADVLSEGGQVVSVATHGHLLVLIYKTYCIFKLVPSGVVIGEISLNNFLGNEGALSQSYLVGGMFLESHDSVNAVDTWNQPGGFVGNVAVWNNRGAAIVFKVSGLEETFMYEPQLEIPDVPHFLERRVSVLFIQLNHNILRIESVCLSLEGSSLWKPHITIWLLCQPHDDHTKLGRQCQMTGEGGFLGDWSRSYSSLSKAEELGYGACTTSDKMKTEVSSWEHCMQSSKNLNGFCGDDGDNCLLKERQVVSSSMVLYGNFCIPCGLVYGFYSGEIKVVRFEMFFHEVGLLGGSPHHTVDTNLSEQLLSGHTGAILCLAAHRMVGPLTSKNVTHVLVSGSMDCTVRIWDLDTSNLIIVLHHHVATVRQIILPPPFTYRPWSDCFLSVGEDSCVALVSLGTLRVERMFPGHPSYPELVVWDSARGYIACLCRSYSRTSDAIDVLYLWDVKTGARERVLHGVASHSMLDHFCRGIKTNSVTENVLGGNTSASSLLLSVTEDASFTQSHSKNFEKGTASPHVVHKGIADSTESSISLAHASKVGSEKQGLSLPVLQTNKHPIKCSCPFPGIATLRFELSSLMSVCQRDTQSTEDVGKREKIESSNLGSETESLDRTTSNDSSNIQGTSNDTLEEHKSIRSIEECLLHFSLSFLHLWDVDHELDRLLVTEMRLSRPENFVVASGLQGDRGSVTLTFPGLCSTLELWRSSSEFCAMRSLTMVSLAQRMNSLSHSSSDATRALAAFYTRKIAEIIPDIKPPLLQLLASFWQHESEHVRMAARSLFHCAASRAIPLPLCGQKAHEHAKFPKSTDTVAEDERGNSNLDKKSTMSFTDSDRQVEVQGSSQVGESSILSWLESFEIQDWISFVGGTSQDAMASHIIVAAALAVWYPSLVKPSLARLVVQPLVKLVMVMNDKYSPTAAELLAEGMENTWKVCIGPEIPHLIGDIFFQIECVSGASSKSASQNPAVAATIREALIGILLPSLAMADIPGFLAVIESQIWATASDSPVHLVSLMTIMRVMRGSPKPLAQYLDKVINFILQTMDRGNSVMRKTCLQSSMIALKEVVRVFPMVALNEASTRLAVGDAIGDISSIMIRVYDMQSMMKIKVLDASGPPGLPRLLAGASEKMVTTAISALSFSPDGEGLVAFSENGLMIRWWSLGSGWWEKLSRNLVPVQCTKLIFVPPWEGFSPNSSRSSVMASIMGHDRQVNSQEDSGGLSDVDSVKLLIHNLDLSYRLEWVNARKVLLFHHGHELGSFQL